MGLMDQHRSVQSGFGVFYRIDHSKKVCEGLVLQQIPTLVLALRCPAPLQVGTGHFFDRRSQLAIDLVTLSAVPQAQGT